MLDYIKKKKEISLNHWRYRLIHWFFGISPKNPTESILPQYIYSHYCPMFHLSNLLLLVLPFAALWKVFALIYKYAIKPVIKSVNSLLGIINTLSKEEVDTQNKSKKDEYASISKAAQQYFSSVSTEYLKDQLDKPQIDEKGDLVHRSVCHNVWLCSYNVVIPNQDLVNIIMPLLSKYVEEVEKSLEYQKKIDEQMTFWINFSRPFVKSLVVAFLISMGCLSVYGLFLSIPPILEGLYLIIQLLCSISLFQMSINALKVLAIVVPLVVGIIAMFRTIPGDIVFEAISGGLSWTSKVYLSIRSFITKLYEDNCPPIEIIDHKK